MSQFANNQEARADSADASDTVTCEQLSLSDLFGRKLSIPEYQRCFCWRKRNVRALLESLRTALDPTNNKTNVHLGTVILKKNDGGFDIVDGQQRLLTLTILSHVFQVASFKLPLLNASFAGRSTDAHSARKHLRWAYATVKEWHESLRRSTGALESALGFADRVRFCVVILPEASSEDLAYSFFDAVNSAGKRLTDYDLLKAHHLRFVAETQEDVAQNMAKRWDETGAEELDRVLHQTLYRLRVWSRHGNPSVDAQDGHQIFEQYSAKASTLNGLFYPSLALSYNSKVRGGAPFFHYTEQYRLLLRDLGETKAALELKKTLFGHSSNVLMESIAALLFLYCCRFGRIYMEDALFCIADVVSSLRNKKQIRATAIQGDIFKECVWALDTSTDPGQFFDWCLAPERQYSPEMGGKTQERYWVALWELYEVLKPRMHVVSDRAKDRQKCLRPTPHPNGLNREIDQ